MFSPNVIFNIFKECFGILNENENNIEVNLVNLKESLLKDNKKLNDNKKLDDKYLTASILCK